MSEKAAAEFRTDDDGPYQFLYKCWVNEAESVVLTQAIDGRDGIIGMIGVPVKYRGNVALALLGGITDELVSDIINDFCSNIDWGDAHFEQEQAEADVRDTLERYFRKRAGLTDPAP